MNKRYIKQSSKVLYTHPRMQLSEDVILLPNGQETTYLKYSHPDSVSVIAINERGEILINHEYTYPLDVYLYQFPAGVIDVNEDPLAAAQRELKEEAGVIAENFELLGTVFHSPRRSKAQEYVYLATNVTLGQHEREAEEFIESSWVSPQEFANMVSNGDIQHHGALAAWALYLNRQFLLEK